MRGNRFIAFALSALMAVSPLAAFSQQSTGAAASDEEEMAREPGWLGEIISVEASDAGTIRRL